MKLYCVHSTNQTTSKQVYGHKQFNRLETEKIIFDKKENAKNFLHQHEHGSYAIIMLRYFFKMFTANFDVRLRLK